MIENAATFILGIAVGLWLAVVIYVVIFNGIAITEHEMVERGFANYNSTTGDFIIKGVDGER